MDDTLIREVTIQRTFDAPRDAVWAAWTDGEQLERWFMPHGFTVPECTVDPRPGGRLHLRVRGPDGAEMSNDGLFEEVDPPQRLVMTTTAFEGRLEVRNTITFEDADGGTELTLHAQVVKAAPDLAAALAGMEEGWLQSFEKLDAVLTGGEVDIMSRAVVASRLLDAPRQAVWAAYTDPEQLERWWAPPGHTIETQQIDVRPGGIWRSTLRGPHGEFEQRITYLTLQEPQVLAYLYGDPDQPGHAFTLVELAEQGGKTTVTVTIHFSSAEERRGMVEHGAQAGLEGALDRVAAYVSEHR
ncbi:MAG TPA: SRPBCC family protein [Actinomycetota bacterium]|jgi:uncharacterized protein YndB with AHSA1/START domain|nr:SRPBCC family protein [Actinomycetota bacterium]